MDKLRPKKSLGQNFLRDNNVIQKIINTFDLKDNDIVLEIGPGMGALTEHLFGRCASLTAVELDGRAIEYLKAQFPSSQNSSFSLINEDIRNINIPKQFTAALEAGKKLKIIGNIPYNISSDIIFFLIENRRYIEKAQLMLQKEVARRLSASPGNKQYGITTIAVDLVGECSYHFDVSPQSFYPPPKVTSAIVELTFGKEISENLYNSVMTMVKIAFNQRRKQLRNSLKNYFNTVTENRTAELTEYFDENKPYLLNKRPEMLSYLDFIDLYNEIKIFNNE